MKDSWCIFFIDELNEFNARYVSTHSAKKFTSHHLRIHFFFSKTTSSKYKNYFANFFVLFVFSWPFFWCRTPKSTSKQVDRNPANVKKMKNKQSGTVKFWTLEKCLLLTNLTGQMFPQSVGFNSHIYLGKSPWKQYERGSLFTNKKAWFDGWKNPLSHSNQTN